MGKRAGLGHVHPHMLRAGFIMAALDAGVPLRDVQLSYRWRHRLVPVSDAVRPSDGAPHGTSLLPADLTADQLDAAPVLDSIDSLLIEELSEDEDDAFAAALES